MKILNLNKFKSNSKGITLIALIVTIIVVLILAGVSISILTGDSGLIKKAQNAADTYKIGEEKEQIQLAYLEYQMKKIKDRNAQFTMDANWALVTGNETTGWTIKINATENEYSLNKDGDINKVDSNTNQWIEDKPNEVPDYENTIITFEFMNSNDDMPFILFQDHDEWNNNFVDFLNEARESGNALAAFPENVISNFETEYTSVHEFLKDFYLCNYSDEFGNATVHMKFDETFTENEKVYIIFAYRYDDNIEEASFIFTNGTADSEGYVNFEISSNDLQILNEKRAIVCTVSQEN